jgi:4-amino-4-deoxy-L-arabinose transferase-like glycosyltransferase
MTKRIKIFLFLIIFLATILRFWQIDKYPAGFNADEASYGYNAYSLILTGRDEHGESWPIHLKSFADYKPAGTAYLAIPFIKLFGLREISVRLPSLLAGVASVLIIFLLVQELFGSSFLSLLTSFFLAISPWHIHFSRGAWESNLGTTFMLLGVWLFYKGFKNPKYYLLSILNFIFSMYTYHTPRVVIPFLGLFLIIFFRKQVFKNFPPKADPSQRLVRLWSTPWVEKWVLISGILGIILIFPLVLSFLGPAGSARFSGVSVFSDVGPVWQVNRLRGEHPDMTALPVKILHNRPIVYLLRIGQNWLSHFDGTFLFVMGDGIKRSNSPEMGELYLFDLVFILAGIYFLIKLRPKNYLFVFFWLLVAPMAASLTFQSPNALRAHNMVIPLVIISAYGFYNLLLLIKKKFSVVVFAVGCLLLAVCISWNFAYYLHQYFVHYPKRYSEAWEYGLKELANYLWPIRNNYDKVYVTEQYDQPYIIFLFYLQYPPEKFQQEVKLTPRDKFGFSTVRDLENIHFENINWDDFRGREEENLLVCGTDREIPDQARIIKEIDFLNGEPALQCAEI